ncbi:trimethylamine methyltransferase family protein, partial [Rhodobaculum claviforme]
AGWLEGGLVASYEKFVMDADQLGALHHLARGVDMSEAGQAMDALREVGPGGHFLGCTHTQAHFQEAFWRSRVFDYKPFETWDEDGARDTQALAAARVARMLGDYEAPPLDPATREALEAFATRRKAEMPDAFG